MNKRKQPVSTEVPVIPVQDIAPASGNNDAAKFPSDSIFRKAFYGSLLAMLVIIWACGFNIGLCSDEMDMNQYGKANYSFYLSGGKDTGFMHMIQEGDSTAQLSTLPYYGSNFEYIATGISYLTGTLNGKNEYNIRHGVNQFFVIVSILFVGLCAVRLGGFRAALITAWLLFLTPTYFGWGLFNTKDIPFATGYIASVYFLLRFFDELPNLGWKSTLYLIGALAFTIGVRIGGVLLFLYLLLFLPLFFYTGRAAVRSAFTASTLKPLAVKLAAVVLLTLGIVIVSWPYVLLSPARHLLEALQSATKFPASILMNYNGEPIHSTDLPPNYLLHYLSITLPVFILVSVPAGLLLITIRNKQVPVKPALFIAFTSIFPLLYAIASGMYLYNGWRHLLFMYPGFIVIAGVGIHQVLTLLKKPVLQYATILCCSVALVHPISWSIKNNPYQYMYYNETLGFKAAYTDYENDVWSISVKPAMDWLFRNGKLKETGDTLVLGTNTTAFAKMYLRTHYPKARVKIVNTGSKNYRESRWDYMVLNTLFLSTDYLQNYFPPESAIHTINVDGLPVTAVLHDSIHLQYECTQAILTNNFVGASNLINQYLASTAKINPDMLGSIAIVKARTRQFDDAIKYGKQAVRYLDNDVFGHTALCFTYYMQNNMEAAVEEINTCLFLAPYDGFIHQLADSISAKIPR